MRSLARHGFFSLRVMTPVRRHSARASTSILSASLLSTSLLGFGLLSSGFLGCVLALTGCSSTESMLAESDVPVPEGLETVRSADIRRARGSLSGGTFLLAGPVMDAGQLLDDTTERYESSGWQIVDREPGLDRAAATYSKDSRTARLEILRRAVEPDMSSATIEVRDSRAAAQRDEK